MSVTERTGETDTYATQNFGLIFPWRAIHEDAYPCHFSGVFYTQVEAEHALATHICPTPARKQYLGMSIAEQYWVELDRVVDELKANDGDSTPTIWQLKGRATGLAFALLKACSPYYDAGGERAVSVAANKRWKMRNGQMDWEPTAGFKYDPPVPGTNPRTVSQEEMATYTQPHNRGSAPVAPTSGRRRRATATPVEKQLTDIEKETIRKAGGVFPIADLAKMYGVTEATIKALTDGT